MDLLIPESNSLKDKRQVVKSLLDGIRNKFNVSAAEIDALDIWRRTVIGVACVSNDKSFANSVLNKVLDSVNANPRVSIESCQVEFV
ncbi:MAG: DUF503 domain-containing protein, partial [Armatimonadetes bacterium]|nr:DUF503 domain-containing protein [Armatimonadota bacterium]